jgi:hypothetical protein
MRPEACPGAALGQPLRDQIKRPVVEKHIDSQAGMRFEKFRQARHDMQAGERDSTGNAQAPAERNRSAKNCAASRAARRGAFGKIAELCRQAGITSRQIAAEIRRRVSREVGKLDQSAGRGSARASNEASPIASPARHALLLAPPQKTRTVSRAPIPRAGSFMGHTPPSQKIGRQPVED